MNHDDLHWEVQWAGHSLKRTGLLVCSRCLDKPQEQFRTLIIPPDPVPIQNPRPGNIEMTSYRITEDENYRITEAEDNRIIE